ncbi:MAG: GTP cyclohydrolase II RibA [bacterium]|nr:GTP cyclohydrolase II RibA [bacterium]
MPKKDYLAGRLGSRASIRSRTWGDMTVESASFTDAVDGDLVVFIGDPIHQEKPLVRIHSECVFAEVFDSDLCDCADQLEMALNRIAAEGHGIFLYLRLDGRGAGLAAKVQATALEVQGVDTFDSRVAIGVDPEGRDFSSVGEYLLGLGMTKIRLLTNSPDKIGPLESLGISVTAVPLTVPEPSEKVMSLYRTKREKFGHEIQG